VELFCSVGNRKSFLFIMLDWQGLCNERESGLTSQLGAKGGTWQHSVVFEFYV
jgi:hypothetical protein